MLFKQLKSKQRSRSTLHFLFHQGWLHQGAEQQQPGSTHCYKLTCLFPNNLCDLQQWIRKRRPSNSQVAVAQLTWDTFSQFSVIQGEISVSRIRQAFASFLSLLSVVGGTWRTWGSHFSDSQQVLGTNWAIGENVKTINYNPDSSSILHIWWLIKKKKKGPNDHFDF